MSDIVTVNIISGPSITVPWFAGMNAQQAMEEAFVAQNPLGEFTYALQYYGKQLGNLVIMINETYESFISSAAPYYYWEFLVNGSPSSKGIDSTILNAGDAIAFELQVYDKQQHASTTVGAKHELRCRAIRATWLD